MKLSDSTRRLLATLENAIDEKTEDAFLSSWKDFLSGKCPTDVFRPMRDKTPTVDYTFQNININDAVPDYEKMLVREVEGALRALMKGQKVLDVRANYGTGIMTSVFGAEIFTMPYETDTLPTTKGIGSDRVQEILDKGMPDLNGGFGKQVFEMGEFFKEAFKEYPKIEKYVRIYHPDTQGPLDICELLIGSELFYMFYDDPDMLKDLLTLVTDTYTAFLNKWYEIVPKTTDYSTHWGLLHKGVLCVRDDSAMNLSPEQYKEFAFPFDSLLLKRFGGGFVHFCGRGDHYIDVLSNAENLYGINMSQPHLNNMEKIYQNTVDKGLAILGFSPEYLEQHPEEQNREKGFSHLLAAL